MKHLLADVCSAVEGVAMINAQIRRGKRCLILFGMLVLVGTSVATHAQQVKMQRAVSSELGDVALGLVASVLVFPVDQPKIAAQGSLIIMPELKNPSRSLDLLLDSLAKSDTEPPRRYFKRYDIAVDGVPYQTTQVHPWGKPSYKTALPYSPKTVSVTAYLSTGETFGATVEVPPDLRLDRSIDIRLNEITTPSDRYIEKDVDPGAKLISPYRDQIVYWINEYAEGGRGLRIETACLGSNAAGRIIHSRLLIKQHYFYAPSGDLILFESRFHQPVYGTDEGVNFNSPLQVVFGPDGSRTLKPLRMRRSDDNSADQNNKYPAKFVLECRTEKGNILRREFEYRWKYPDRRMY